MSGIAGFDSLGREAEIVKASLGRDVGALISRFAE